MPNRGHCAQSQQRRISRWLQNPRIVVSELYGQLITTALSDWSQSKLYLSLDSSLLWNQYCLIRLVVIHRGRGLTVAWRVIEHASSSVAYEDYQQVLAQARDRIPKHTDIVVLADRGVIHTDLMQAIDQIGWGYRIQLKANSWVWRSGHGWSRVNTFHLAAGEALLLHTVRLHKTQFFGPVHLALARHPNGEFWAVLSNQTTSLKTFEEYGWRFDADAQW